MSNFDFEAYRQVYPEAPTTPIEVESAVETFKPTEEKLNEKPTDTEAGVDEEVIEKPQETGAEDPAKGDNENG